MADANDAIDQIRQGKKAEGTETLTKLAGEIHDPAIKAQIEEVLGTVTTFDQHQEQVRELNRAVSFAVSRKWSEALAILDHILPEIKDDELAARAREVRKQVVEASKRK